MLLELTNAAAKRFEEFFNPKNTPSASRIVNTARNSIHIVLYDKVAAPYVASVRTLCMKSTIHRF
jgi:hypothetical protein